MNINRICVFDFETDGINPSECNPVQIAASIIHPVKLVHIPGAEFCSYMRPLNIDDDDYYEKHEDTIKWHARNYKCDPEHIFETWKEAPSQKDVWNAFLSWLKKYHTKQSGQTKFSAPIAAGYNIIKFDMEIIRQLCYRYGDIDKDGSPKIFHPRDIIDLIHKVWWWFESQAEPSKYTMDALRDYFDIPSDNAHDALKDVRDEGWLLIKLLKTQRWVTNSLAEKGKLKGAYKQ